MSADGEFAFIARHFAALSDGAAGADALRDDGAIIDLQANETLVISTDTLVSGVHFLPNEDPNIVARRALRTALSDLAAMGARAFGYTLNLTLPKVFDDVQIARFCEGLATDQALFSVRLLGGDTTAGAEQFIVTITVFGRRPCGVSLRRHSARAGDSVVVTGSIGDAGLGLQLSQGDLYVADCDEAFLLRRYRLPEPRLAAAAAVRRYVNAAIDVSDGLLADVRHIAARSGLTVHLDLGSIPLSDAARRWLELQAEAIEARLMLATAGDDYELALTTQAPDALIAALSDIGLAAHVVGSISEFQGEALKITYDRQTITPKRTGFTHF